MKELCHWGPYGVPALTPAGRDALARALSTSSIRRCLVSEGGSEFSHIMSKKSPLSAHGFGTLDSEIRNVITKAGFGSATSFATAECMAYILDLRLRGHISGVGYDSAVTQWRKLRKIVGLKYKTEQSIEEEEPMTVKMNAERNEMIALIQHAKGVQFVEVTIQTSTLVPAGVDELGEILDRPKSKTSPILTYKAMGLDLVPGDIVVVQFRSRYGLAKVFRVLEDVPTSAEYDYENQMRFVIQKVDVERSAALDDIDRQLLKRLTASEAKDRVERLTRQLGISLDEIVLELPSK